MMTRLERQIQFIVEVDKVKQIFRQTYLSDAARKENDAEHSWHLALMACLLEEYVSDPVDVARVTTMVLIHDLVEIDAGDTYAYDPEGAKTKAEREKKAQGTRRVFCKIVGGIRGIPNPGRKVRTPIGQFPTVFVKSRLGWKELGGTCGEKIPDL